MLGRNNRNILTIIIFKIYIYNDEMKRKRLEADDTIYSYIFKNVNIL